VGKQIKMLLSLALCWCSGGCKRRLCICVVPERWPINTLWVCLAF